VEERTNLSVAIDDVSYVGRDTDDVAPCDGANASTWEEDKRETSRKLVLRNSMVEQIRCCDNGHCWCKNKLVENCVGSSEKRNCACSTMFRAFTSMYDDVVLVFFRESDTDGRCALGCNRVAAWESSWILASRRC